MCSTSRGSRTCAPGSSAPTPSACWTAIWTSSSRRASSPGSKSARAAFSVRGAQVQQSCAQRTLPGKQMNDETPQAPDENKLIAERRHKLAGLRAQGIAFPNDFAPDAFAGDLQGEFADHERWSSEAFEQLGRRVRVAGRILLKRVQ